MDSQATAAAAGESGQPHDGLSARTIAQLGVMCPQTLHAEFRARGPIAPDEDGGLMVYQMRELREVSRHPGVDGRSSPPFGHGRPTIPLEIDGPPHTTFRRLLNPLFSPGAVAGLEPAVREITDELIDSFIEAGHADVYRQFCEVLPAKTFLKFMGLPLSGLSEYLDFKEESVRYHAHETPEQKQVRRLAATDRFDVYFRDVLRARRAAAEQPDDLMTALLGLRIDGELLDENTIFDIVHILIIGGLDTLAASLSLDLCWLARHPDDRHRLVATPELWRTAVDELLRFEAIIPVSHRYAREDITISGQEIKAGTSVNISLAGANLDPSVFLDPLSVDLERYPNPHVTFAAGIHHCLGAHLARLELTTVLDQFHRRIPDYELETEVELHFESVPIRLVRPLPLVWTPDPDI